MLESLVRITQVRPLTPGKAVLLNHPQIQTAYFNSSYQPAVCFSTTNEICGDVTAALEVTMSTL